MKQFFPVAILVIQLLLLAPLSMAGDNGYRYITASELEQALISSQKINILDIQVESDFSQHHIVGAVPTHAYPVKSAEDKAKLAAVLSQLEKSSLPIVIICPRGQGGAKRTYLYLKEKGISEERLQILENGQAGWTANTFTISN